MSHQINHFYEFGPFRLDAVERLLSREGIPIPLTPKAFDLLMTLVEQPGHLLAKEELMQSVWPDTFVEENSLTWNISNLRKILGDGENGLRYIETVPKRGYRFVADVQTVSDLKTEEPSHKPKNNGVAASDKDADFSERLVAEDQTNSRARIGAESAAEVIASVGLQQGRWGDARLAWIVAALAGLAALALALALLRRPHGESRATFTYLPLPPKTAHTIYGGFAISPDGRRVTIVIDNEGVNRLWLYSFDQAAPTLLVGAERVWMPFWSPDGRNVGFFAQGKLKRIDVSGGAPVTLCDAPKGAGAAWSNAGVILFAPHGSGSGLYQVPESGGTPKPVTHLDAARNEMGHQHPHFLPDGRHFFYRVNAGLPTHSGIRLGSIDGIKTDFFLQSNTNGLYSTAGYLLFLQGRKLLAQKFDPDKLALSGEPALLMDDVYYHPNTRYAYISAFSDRTLIYQSNGNQNRRLVWLNRSGKELTEIGQAGEYTTIEFSPDGKQAMLERIDPLTTSADLWQLDLSRETLTRVTLNGGSYSPIWAPDGNRVAFISMREGFYGVYQKTLGVDKEELLFNADLRSTWLSDWSRDGRFLVFRKENESTEYDITLLPLFGDRKPRDYVATEFSDGWAKVSPDGRWLAYQSNESGRFEIYVQSFPNQGRKVIISKGGGKLPRWRSDGKELYYVAEDDWLMAAPVRTGSSFSAGAPVELFKLGAYDRTAFRYAYEVSPDGQKFLALRPEEEASERPLTVVQNWTELLKK